LKLDVIIASCPFLEELYLIHACSDFEGSLECLSNLQSLNVSKCKNFLPKLCFSSRDNRSVYTSLSILLVLSIVSPWFEIQTLLGTFHGTFYHMPGHYSYPKINTRSLDPMTELTKKFSQLALFIQANMKGNHPSITASNTV